MSELEPELKESEDSFQFFQSFENFNLVYIKLEIFLYLDYKSLHEARQVCKDWNEFIKTEIWSSRLYHCKRLLAKCWRQDVEPHNRVIECPKDLGFYLAVNDKILGLGTKNYNTLVLDPSSGDSLGALEMNSLDAVVDKLFPDPNVHDEEAQDVQLDVTDQVIVTVAGSGLVAVWDRVSLSLLYSACPHGLDNVLGVRVIGDFMVTGGSHGSLAAFSIITAVAPQSTPVVKEECNMARVHRAISHIDSDGSRVLVGTERELVLWDFSERAAPRVQSQVNSGQVCCCVMSFPHAFCTGLFLNHGVQVWDMKNQVKIRHIHTNLSMWVITIKDNLLATSMSVLRDEEMEEDSLGSPCIFIHDIPELVDPNVKTEKVWAKELKCPIEHFSDPHIALNTTSLFAVTRNAEEGSKIHVWDFWNY